MLLLFQATIPSNLTSVIEILFFHRVLFGRQYFAGERERVASIYFGVIYKNVPKSRRLWIDLHTIIS